MELASIEFLTCDWLDKSLLFSNDTEAASLFTVDIWELMDWVDNLVEDEAFDFTDVSLVAEDFDCWDDTVEVDTFDDWWVEPAEVFNLRDNPIEPIVGFALWCG